MNNHEDRNIFARCAYDCKETQKLSDLHQAEANNPFRSFERMLTLLRRQKALSFLRFSNVLTDPTTPLKLKMPSMQNEKYENAM